MTMKNQNIQRNNSKQLFIQFDHWCFLPKFLKLSNNVRITAPHHHQSRAKKMAPVNTTPTPHNQISSETM